MISTFRNVPEMVYRNLHKTFLKSEDISLELYKDRLEGIGHIADV